MGERRPRASQLAFTGLMLGVSAYELLAPKDELLTDVAHRNIESENPIRRWGTRLAIGVTALHLMNLLPKAVDPFTYMSRLRLQDREAPKDNSVYLRVLQQYENEEEW